MLKGETLLEGRYKIVKILGQGGMGAVYLAEDQRLPTHWAIKEMKREGLSAQELAEAADLFRSEARLLTELRHRNLPRIIDFFQKDVQLYLVMDFVEGETLEDRIQRDGPISLPFALDLCLQISDVLDYLHTRPKPVVFRDFKPGNVMLSPQNEVKLVDFGIARVFNKDKSSDTRALGTPGYAAPEQYGTGQSAPRTDLFAFGATVHHALTGRDPTQEPFIFPPLSNFRQDLPPEFSKLIERCLALKPEERPESAFAIKRELEQMMGHTGSASLAGRPTTTRLDNSPAPPPAAVAPGTLPLPAGPTVRSGAPAAPAPTAGNAGHSVTFMPNTLLFKNLAHGHKATARLRVRTAKPITLFGHPPQLTVEPTQVQAGTSTVIVTVDSKGLAGGTVYKGAIEVQQVEDADLPVEAHLGHPRASAGVMMTAVGLAVGTLIPLVNYLCTVVLCVVVLSTPSAQRASLRIPWRLSFFFSLCWTAFFAALGLGLFHVYGASAQVYWDNFISRF